MMRKPLYLMLAVLVVVLVATRVRLTPKEPVPADDVVMVSAGPSGLYWVNKPEEGQSTLLAASRVGSKPEPVAAAASILSLAPAGKGLVYLTEDQQPNSGQLWRAQPKGGPPQSLVQGLRSPQGLLATRDNLYWAETRPSPAPGIACVPVLQPLSLISRANADGQGRALLAVSESAETHFPGKFLGERDGKLYWLQHFGQQYSRPTMSIWRVPLAGGAAEQVVRAQGEQDAVLASNMIYFTAPSEEMSPPLSGRTVRCVPLSGGEPRTLTDWMAAGGRLLLVGQKPYYCDQQLVWRIPPRLGEARPVAKPNLDFRSVANYRGALYGRVTEKEKTRLVRCPLTMLARLRGLFGP